MSNWFKRKIKSNNIFLDILRNNANLTDFALSEEALKHSKSYSELLSTYVKSTKRNALIKDILKILFFLITIGTLVGIVWIFYKSIDYAFDFFGNSSANTDISVEDILSVVTVLVPSISSLIVAFIKIPEIIAKYLFNIQEDTYMNSIIKNIQEHDKSMFAMEHKINVTLAENKMDSSDDTFEESPSLNNQSSSSDENQTA